MANNTQIQDLPTPTPRSSNMQKIQQIESIDERFSVKGIMRRLPNFMLLPGLMGLFALLIVDLAISDPLPVVDEAALFYLLMSGLKVLGERRKIKKEIDESLDEPDVVADVFPESTTIRDEPISATSL